MKKIIALLLTLALALCCFAGCEEDEKNNPSPEQPTATIKPTEDNNALPIADFMTAIQALSSGVEFNMTYDVSFKVADDKNDSDEMVNAILESLFEKQSDGTFKTTLGITGEGNQTSAQMTVKMGGKDITDVIVADSNVFINMKSVLMFAAPLAGAEGFEWPVENEYIDLKKIMELQSGDGEVLPEEDLNGDDPSLEIPGIGSSGIIGNVPSIEDIAKMFGMTVEDMQAVINEIMQSVPLEKIVLLAGKIQNMAIETKLISGSKTDKESSITIKLDKTNIADIFKGFIEIVKSDLVSIIDPVIVKIKASDKIPAEIKSFFDGYNKDEVQADLDKELTDANIAIMIDEMKKELGNTGFLATIKTDGSGVELLLNAVIDIPADEKGNDDPEISEDTSIPLSNMTFNVIASMKPKSITDIKAPTKVITDADLDMIKNAVMG